MATIATDKGRFMFWEPLSRGAHRCVNRFTEGQIGAESTLQPTRWALNATPRGLGFMWGNGSQARDREQGQSQVCVADFLRKHPQ